MLVIVAVIAGIATGGAALVPILLVALLFFWLEKRAKRKRREDLIARFGLDATERILRGTFWQGATEEMVVEAMGRPLDIDEKVMRASRRLTYKYNQQGRGKFALRVIFEDGVCVGWDDKR